MTESQDSSYARYKKKAWAMYTVIAAAVIVFLVLVVAQDNEERLFYGLMGAAAAYVLRPTEKFMKAQIARFVPGPQNNDDA